MRDDEALAWLGRKICWGRTPEQWQAWSELDVDVVLDELVDPAGSGIAPRPNPFDGLTIERNQAGPGIRAAVTSWLDNAIASTRPLETFMEFFWSDYFAVSIRSLRPRDLMLAHMNLLAEHALGNFSELLRAVTVDPAMLDFLDGGRSTKDNPNENYGRELLELYSVGIGEFTEDDVKAASRALTGYRLRRNNGSVQFRSAQHDDTPQTLLGVSDVHDVDTTIDAVLAHPATAPRVVDKLATAILGPGYDTAIVGDLARDFGTDWELRPLVRKLLEHGVDGHATPSLLEPIGWYVTARKLPTSEPRLGPLRQFFGQSGQQILFPPNVGGFPSPDAYLSTSATLARFNLASHLAVQSARVEGAGNPRAMTNDLDELAMQCGLVDGFRPTTKTALESLEPGIDRLAAVLASPDLVVI